MIDEDKLREYFEFADSLGEEGFVNIDYCKVFSKEDLDKINAKRKELFGWTKND